MKDKRLLLAMDYAAAMEAAAAYVEVCRPSLTSAKLVYEFVRPLFERLTGDTQESFLAIPVDKKMRPLGAPIECTRGVVDSCPVHPREIFKEAIIRSASGVFLAHNHPSGDPEPSGADIRLTKRMIEAGQLLGIEVLDHVVAGRKKNEYENGYSSILEMDLCRF